MTDHFDAVIVGAGMAGRATALGLAHTGFDVLLCDRAEKTAAKDDPRTTALSYASVRALDRLGVWDALSDKAQPVTEIAVAQASAPTAFRPGGRGASLHFDDGLLADGDRWDGMPLAYIVRNTDLIAALNAATEAGPRVTCRFGAEVATTTPDGAGVEVGFGGGGEAVRASLVIACDGRRSRLRRRAGFRTITRDFHQDAVTFVVGHTALHGSVARQVFLPGGPLAALPLVGGEQSSIVWSMPRAKADAVMAEPGLLAGMAMENLPELGQVEMLGGPARFPLGLLYATTMVADRLALIGEAGRAIHPIAGQGYNMAIADACALADVLSEARGVGLDIGHGTVLARYDDWRRPDAAMTAFGTSGLAAILSTTERVTRRLADAGFGVVQGSGGLRAAFARRAGGSSGRVPSLMVRPD